MNITWTITEHHIIGKTQNFQTLTSISHVASFDLDDTIIKPKSGKKFSENEDDFMLLHANIKPKLTELSKTKQLIIVTNQKGITTGKTDKTAWMNKVNSVIKLLDLEFMILCCVDDVYRKPNIRIWEEFIVCDKNNSFYCGDAGGLLKRNIKNVGPVPKDFADTDAKFALNLGIKFVHRDEFAYDSVTSYNITYPNIKDYIKSQTYKFIKPPFQELIINTGLPGSGKSFFTKNVILPQNYVHVNQDVLKTNKKCVMMLNKYLSSGNSVVLDNTNVTEIKETIY